MRSGGTALLREPRTTPSTRSASSCRRRGLSRWRRRSTRRTGGCRGARPRSNVFHGRTGTRSACCPSASGRARRPDMKALRALALATALAGCATLERPFSDHLESAVLPVRDCAAWFAALDEAVEGAGVRDAQEARIAGFPYLRVDRSLSALTDRAGRDVPATQAFAIRLAALDYAARKAEIEK